MQKAANLGQNAKKHMTSAGFCGFYEGQLMVFKAFDEQSGIK